MSSNTTEPTILFKIRSSLACVPCRSRHIKCDANKPNCVRCQVDGRSCHYVQSRRGLKYKTPPANSVEDGVPRDLSDSSSKHQTGTPIIRSSTVLGPETRISSLKMLNIRQTQILGSQRNPISRQSNSDSPEDSTRTHLDLYYTFFHHAHPYVLPRRQFDVFLQTNRSQVEDLLIVMQFIASTYTSQGQSAELKQQAVDRLSRDDLPFTGFTVQALLLLAISVHCCNSFQLARSLLDKASSIALEIGMQFKYFAATHSNGSMVLEESWRRTWWGLYTVDGIFQVIQRSPYFALWHVQADVELPCEESEYDCEVRVFLKSCDVLLNSIGNSSTPLT